MKALVIVVGIVAAIFPAQQMPKDSAPAAKAALIFSVTYPPAEAGGLPHGIREEMLVSTAWLAQHLHDPDLVLLCVEADDGFCARASIPISRVLQLSDIAVTRNGIPNELAPLEQLRKVFADAGVTPGSKIVLYGERYGLFAARVYFTLDYLSLAEHAALLDGGVEKWRAERKPLSRTTARKQSSAITSGIHEEALITTGELRGILRSPSSATLLDARPEDEFSGKRLSEDVSKAGHIPGAKSVYWMNLLISREDPVLRPEAELRQMFSQAGAVPGKAVVTYCRTGMQSSFDYFVAKYLGYDVRMYDGSFFEWSREELPVEK